MPEFTINDFSAGWTPGDDPINGRRNGLLRMDNVELDSNGALALAGGCAVKNSGYVYNAHTLFSRLINGARHDYLADTNGGIFRNTTSIGTGGDSTNAAFGSAFNFTLACSGNTRKKDTGAAVVNLGLLPATVAPTLAYGVAFSPQKTLGQVTGATVDVLGTSAVIGGTYLQVTADANGVWIVQTYNGFSDPHNLNQLTGVDGETGYATDEDFIQLVGYTPYPWGRSLQLDVLLVAGNVAGDPVSDYYSFTIEDIATLDFSANGTFLIRIRRREFIRYGTGAQDWSTTYGFRLTFVGGLAGEVVNILADGISGYFIMTGGDKAQNGQYQYLQVNVNNTGSYLAKSIAGPVSVVINVDMGQVKITPQDPSGVDSQCNEAWIYRRGGLLDAWYRVKVFAGSYTAKYDTLSDESALALNLKLNTNLVSIASSSISDKIYEIIGPVNGRWYYFTTNFIYPSDINNPDLVDSTLAVRMTGSSSELFLWARQINDTTIMVGTSMDVYLLNGTFASYPDNTIDIYYRGLQCKFPPLTCDAETFGGLVYYLANDGWRVIDGGGGNPSMVSPNLDRLYRGETLEGYVPPNLKVLPRSIRLPIVIAKNKMWCFITGIASPRIEVYDFIRQYWRVVNYGIGDVTAATHTQDGQVLAFFSTDKKTREIDIQTSKLIDAATKQPVSIKTMVFDGQTPRQRKDSSTLKIRTINAESLSVSIYVDTTSVPLTILTATTSSIVADKNFDLAGSVTTALVKTYQVHLTSTAGVFTLQDFNFIYDLRPEQRSFLRIQSNNYGTVARKKIASVPLQLDSLGNTVTVRTYLDGVANATLTHISNRKTSDQINFSLTSGELPTAKDYEYTLEAAAGLFEFFDFQEPRILEVFPQGCLAYNIPATNFGNANKKRLRTWPFVLSAPAGAIVSFTPLIDGVDGVTSSFLVTSDKLTYRYYFKTDVFGVDYGGYFSSPSVFEVGDILLPEIVQILPIAKRFDQVGPEEFFRYGKIKQIELRIHPIGGSQIPFTIYFSDTENYTGTFNVTNGKEDTYFIMLPKGTSGHVVRIELGPTDFDFHRFYTRLQVTASGNDTDLKWINL